MYINESAYNIKLKKCIPGISPLRTIMAVINLNFPHLRGFEVRFVRQYFNGNENYFIFMAQEVLYLWFQDY